MIKYIIVSFNDYSQYNTEANNRKNYLNIILRNDLYNEGRYYLIDVYDNDMEYSFGVITTASYEQCKCIVCFDKLFIGYNNEIAIFKDGNIIKTDISKYDHLMFYDFVYDNKYDILMAVFEIGVVCFDNKGLEKWNLSLDDIISEYSISNDILKLTTFENNRYEININNGTIVQKILGG